MKIKDQKKAKQTYRQGSAIILTVTVLGLVLAMALTVSAVLLAELNINADMSDSLTAIYAADSGMEWALYEIRQQNIDTPQMPSLVITNTSGEDSIAQVISFTAGGTTTIKSIGNYRDAYRAFQTDQPLGNPD